MAKEQVEQVLQALAGLEEFSSSPYLDALKSQISLDSGGIFNDAPKTVYDEVPSGDDRVMEQFKVQTIVLGLSRSSGCSFDRTVNVSGIESKMDATASSIAHAMYRDYLEKAVAAAGRDKPSLLTLEKDQEFCTAFADYVLDPDFINRTLIARYLSASSTYPEAVAYIYERVRATLATTDKHADTSKYSAQTHWMPHAEKNQGLLDAQKVADFLQASLPVQWSTEDALKGPSFPLLGRRISLQWCTRQDWKDLVNEQISHCYKEPDRMTPITTGRHPPHPIIGAKTYGKDLQNWIRRKRGQYSDLFTGVEPDNFEPPREAGGACFVAGTKVRTVDGDVNIESLQKGVKVLTKAPGEYGTLSDERVETHSPGEGNSEYAYGFNGEKPFVTAGHIFFTTAGPKAINPAIAREENPNVVVSQLRVGDELYRLDEANTGAAGYAKVCITTFTVGRAEENVVYGLHFHQGSHAGARYHANGYLVAANYPEITLKRFEDRFVKLPVREQKTSIAAIQSMPDSLSGVFGSVLTSFKNSFTPDRVPQPGDLRATHERARKRMEHKRVSATSLVMAFALRPIAGGVDDSLPEVWLKEGAVMVDSELVPQAEVTHEHVHWSRERAPGVWEHGSLHFSADGLMATGAVALEEGGELSSPAHVVASPVELTYSPLGTTTTFEEDSKADEYIPTEEEVWLAFWSIKIEMVQTPEHLLQFRASLPQLDQLCKDQKLEDSIYKPVLSQKKGQLTVDIVISDGFEDIFAAALEDWPNSTTKPQLFKRLQLQVNLVTGSAKGNYTDLVDGEDGPIHALRASGSDKHELLMQRAPEAIASSPSAHLDHGLNTDLYSISANIHARPSPQAALLTAEVGDRPLSIPELQQLEVPSAFENHQVTQNYVMAAAGYWRADREKQLFGDAKGANESILPVALKDQLGQDKRTFLGETYTRGLFLYSLSHDQRYQANFTDEQRNKLQYFWDGKAKTCLSQSPEFGAVNSLAVKAAYVAQVPRLQDYYHDSEDWAEKFYTAVSTDEYLNLMIMSKGTGLDLANRVCMILDVLDKQNRGYPAKLWGLILSKAMGQAAYEGAPLDTDAFARFAVEFAQQLIVKVRTKDPSIGKDMVDDLAFDIDAMEKAYQTTSEQELASQLFGRQGELGRFFLEAAREAQEYFGKKNLKKLPDVVQSTSEKAEASDTSPEKKARIKKMTGVFVKISAIMTQGYQLASALKYLLDWNDLSDIDRAKAILQVVESTFRLIGDMAPILKALGQRASEMSQVKYLIARWNQAVGGEAGRATVPIDGTEVPVMNQKGLAQVNSEAGDLPLDAQVGKVTSAANAEEKMTAWAKASKVGAIAIKTVVAVSNVAVVVGLGLQIEREWGYESPGVIVLDIINLSTVAAQVAIEVTEIGYAICGAETVVLPLLGAVVAIVGIVIMIIELGVGHSAPPDPTVTYIKEVTPDFVKNLSTRPKPVLTYKTVPDTAPTMGSWMFTLDITDETKRDFRVESFHIAVPVGNGERDLFSRPDPKDTKGPINIQCTVSDPERFSVKSSLSPSAENHIMLFQVIVIDNTKPVGQLSITFAGPLNGQKGEANISVTEIPPQDGNSTSDDSRTDRVKNMVIAKKELGTRV